MNKNILQIGLGFGAGYLTRSLLNERHATATATPGQEKTDMARVIRKSKEVYDAALEHPERLPEAFDQARKVVVAGNGDPPRDPPQIPHV